MPNLLEAQASFVTCPPPGYEGGLDGWELLAARVKCQTGVVAIVPDPAPVTTGMILLPDQAAANAKPDIGTVISSGVEGLKAGDRALYMPFAGVWMCPFRVGGYEVEELRFYGLVSPGSVEDLVVYEPMEDCVPARLDSDKIVPIGEMVLIRRDPLRVTHGTLSLALPDDAKYRAMKATIVAAGPKAFGFEKDAEGKPIPLVSGQRVMYHGPSLIVGLKGVGQAMGWTEDLGDYALIKARNLYCVLEEE